MFLKLRIIQISIKCILKKYTLNSLQKRLSDADTIRDDLKQEQLCYEGRKCQEESGPVGDVSVGVLLVVTLIYWAKHSYREGKQKMLECKDIGQ